MKQIIILSVLALIFSSFKSETKITKKAANHFAQFVVADADTPEEAKKIDQYMRAQAGVVMSRMDPHSKKYLIIYTADMGYDKNYFEQTFNQLGFSIKCHRTGVHGTDTILDQKLDCE